MSRLTKVGNKQNPVLFCISGMFAGDWVWSKTVEYLKNDFYLNIMKEPLCLIGNSIESIEDYIYKIIEEENLKDIYFVGNSLGGLLSLIIGNKRQDQTRGIIISGAPGLSQTNLGIGISKKPDKDWVKLLLSKNFFDMQNIKDIEIAVDNVTSYFDSRQTYKNIIRLTKESNTIENFNIDSILFQTKTPIFAIWGEKDIVSPIEPWLPFFDNHKIIYTQINKAGHSPMFEQEESFSNAIIQFKENTTIDRD